MNRKNDFLLLCFIFTVETETGKGKFENLLEGLVDGSQGCEKLVKGFRWRTSEKLSAEISRSISGMFVEEGERIQIKPQILIKKNQLRIYFSIWNFTFRQKQSQTFKYDAKCVLTEITSWNLRLSSLIKANSSKVIYEQNILKYFPQNCPRNIKTNFKRAALGWNQPRGPFNPDPDDFHIKSPANEEDIVDFSSASDINYCFWQSINWNFPRLFFVNLIINVSIYCRAAWIDATKRQRQKCEAQFTSNVMLTLCRWVGRTRTLFRDIANKWINDCSIALNFQLHKTVWFWKYTRKYKIPGKESEAHRTWG